MHATTQGNQAFRKTKKKILSDYDKEGIKKKEKENEEMLMIRASEREISLVFSGQYSKSRFIVICSLVDKWSLPGKIS